MRFIARLLKILFCLPAFGLPSAEARAERQEYQFMDWLQPSHPAYYIMKRAFVSLISGCLFLVCFSAGLKAQAPDLVPATDADYRQIQKLENGLGIENKLPQDGASRGVMLVNLAAVAGRAAGVSGSWAGGFKAGDYDALYALLQKYRDELRALGIQSKEWEDLLVELKVKAVDLREKVDNLHPLDGLKIHGRFLVYYDELMLTGPGVNAGDAMRYRHAINRTEMEFTYTQGLLHGVAQIDIMGAFGDYYDWVNARMGARKILIEALAPVAVQIGDLHYRMTPLTFWRNEDTYPLEPEPFKRRQQRLRDDLFLKDDHAYFLRGLRTATDLVISDSLRIEMQVLVNQLGAAGNSVYTTYGTRPVKLETIYNTYLGAWQASVPVGKDRIFTPSYQGTIIRNATDSDIIVITGGYDTTMTGLQKPGFDSQVHSGAVELNVADGKFKLNGEYAMSLFSSPALLWNHPDVGHFGYLAGSAMNAQAVLDLKWLKLNAGYRNVSEDFVSAPAQGRTQDAYYSPLGPFATENTMFDPSTRSFNTLNLPQPPETQLNGRIIPPEIWYSSGPGVMSPAYALIPSHPGLNALDPYGLATPNRSGFGAGAQLVLLKGLMTVSGAMDSAAEIETWGSREPIKYTRYEGALKFDLAAWRDLPVRAGIGYRLEDTNNGDWVAFTSSLMEAGLELDGWEGSTFSFGYRHLDYNGMIPYSSPVPFASPDPALLGFGRRTLQEIWDLWGLSLLQVFNRSLSLELGYSVLTFANPIYFKLNAAVDKRNSYEADQGWARLVILF